jgi:membrane protein DedA with SNARE-associated domain
MDADTVKEVVVAAASVLAVIAVMAYIGMNYGNDTGVLTTQGGQMLAYAIAGFVVLMAIVGYTRSYWLDLEDEE